MFFNWLLKSIWSNQSMFFFLVQKSKLRFAHWSFGKAMVSKWKKMYSQLNRPKFQRNLKTYLIFNINNFNNKAMKTETISFSQIRISAIIIKNGRVFKKKLPIPVLIFFVIIELVLDAKRLQLIHSSAFNKRKMEGQLWK